MTKKQQKPWHKKWWVWAAIIVVLIVFGSAANNSSDTAVKTNDGSANKTSKEKQKVNFKTGDTASFKDKSISVKEVQRNYTTGNQYLKAEPGKEFVIVTIHIVNNSDSKMDYNTFEFKMQDSNGVQQSESFTALTTGKLNSGSLAPGGKVTGKLAYEVPKGDKGLKLLYESMSLFDNQAITFDLK